MLDNFTNSINPLTVQTMMMLVGDESLQFRFVASKTDLTAVNDGITYGSFITPASHCINRFTRRESSRRCG